MTDQFQRLVDEIIWPITSEISTRLVRTMSPDPSKSYYHYTSADGLKSIIETGTLRAGSIKYSNDAHEFQHGFDAILNDLTAAIRAGTGSAHVIQHICDMFRADAGQFTCACCFSELSDDLEQWRGYGANGFGYAIGLNLRGLVATNAQEQSAMGDELTWEVYKVLYNTDHIRSAIIDPVVDHLDSLSLPDSEARIVAQFLSMGLARYSPIFKHSAFAHEQEVRLVTVQNDYAGLRFRIRNSVFYPFAELRLTDKTLPITEIVIGPCLAQGQARPSLRMFMAKHGYERVPIRPSAVPYLP